MGNEIAIQVMLREGVDPALFLPRYAQEGDAGMDVRAAIQETMVLLSGATAVIPTGLSVAIPAGYELQVRPRSGLAAAYGVTVLNAPGTIDAKFRGEIGVILINHSYEDFSINPGDRIAQIVLNQFETIHWQPVEELPSSARGTGGFGSTGVQ